MVNIIIFGELPIATKIAKYVNELEGVSIPCVVCENYKAKNADPWSNVPMLFDYADKNDIPVVSLSELASFCKVLDVKPTVGITARFSKILKKKHLDIFKHGLINLHGGLLPEFGGLYSVNHMLLSGEKVGGGSIHWVDLGIDTGKLIKRCTCEIDESDTALSLHHKVQFELYAGVCDLIQEGMKVGFDNLSEDEVPKDAVPSYYSKSSLSGLKEIKASDLFSEKSLRTIRAFDFPGCEPAFTYIRGKKIELRYGA